MTGLPDTPLFCDRCMKTLTPGKGDFYVVKIEAAADPTPPVFSQEDLTRDPKLEIERLLARMQDISPQEALDQVHRRVTLFLCSTCYQRWIEDPIA